MLKAISAFFLMLISFASFAEKPSWEDLTFTYMEYNFSFDYEKHVNSYMLLFQPKIWAKYSGNEFEIGEKRAKAIEAMKERARQVDRSKTYTKDTYIFLEKYDFKNQLFPFDSRLFKQDNQDNIGLILTYGVGVISLPIDYQIYFSNADSFNALRIDKEKAKELLESRPSGHFNRRLPITVKYNLADVTTDKNRYKIKYTAIIEEINIYSDDRRKNLLITLPLKAQDQPQNKSVQLTSKIPSEYKLGEMISDYYNNQGEWAGKYKIDSILKLKIEKVSQDEINVHALYHYVSVKKSLSGKDKRVFNLRIDRLSSKWKVMRMGKNNSARI